MDRSMEDVANEMDLPQGETKIPVAQEVPMAVEVEPIPNEQIPMARVVDVVREITRQQTS